MNYQYNYDADGKPVGVFIPINEWELIEERLQELNKQKKVSAKAKTLKSIKKGMEEVRKIQQKKIKSIPVQTLLDAL